MARSRNASALNVLVIHNPAAGRGRSGPSVQRLCACLRDMGHSVEYFPSPCRGAAGERAGKIGPDVNRLVIAGGDGTVNEVLNGLTDPSVVPLCHFAVGTANMLAHELGLPKNPALAAQIIEAGAALPIDLGLVEGRRFLSLVSAGFDGLVTQEIVGLGRKIKGYCGYARPIAKALRRYRPVNLEVRVDGRDTFIGTNVMVLKVRKYGGVFVFAQNASFDSGSFEVRVFSGRSLFSLAKYGLAGIARVAEKLRDVHRFSARTVEISADCPFPVEADGDYIGSGPVSISLSPQRVRAIVPFQTEETRLALKGQSPCPATPEA